MVCTTKQNKKPYPYPRAAQGMARQRRPMWRPTARLLCLLGALGRARGWLLPHATAWPRAPASRCRGCLSMCSRAAAADVTTGEMAAGVAEVDDAPCCLHVDTNGNDRVVPIGNLPAPSRSHVRVVLVSDTHERLHEVALPLGDVLVHTGDITFCARGGFSTLAAFNEYIGQLPHPHKIVIAGNHDRHIEHIGKEAARRLFTSAHYLENSGIRIRGLHFWGTPFSSV